MSGSDRRGVAAGRGPSTTAATVLLLLRVAVGWHFLYEGASKLTAPGWTSLSYLEGATGPLAGLFHTMAASPATVRVVDLLNVWGLLLVGAALMLGVLTRLTAGCGILMLALYYLAHPPFGGTAPGMGVEGHYLLVDKNLVELLALIVVAALPASRRFALDRLLGALWARRRRRAPGAVEPTQRELEAAVNPDPLGRRAVLASLAGVPFLGAFLLAALRKHGWRSHEEERLAAEAGTDAVPGTAVAAGPATAATTSATIKTFQFTTLAELKGPIPHAKIKDLELSRLILGGNLVGGWAHARDLIYVSKLVKAYHHKWKVFETFALAERCGINAFLTNPVLCEIIDEYWKRGIGRIQFISDCGGSDVLAMVQRSIDHGAAACYIQGATGDRLVRQKKFDVIAQALELIRRNGLPAGIGGHRLATVQACVERGLIPDFWMKTLHHTRYWSAQPKDQCDNIWCEHPDETIAFMRERPEPWIAFKTLAAGAIHPKVGFRFALKGGADFLCVGMYDFQIVEDANLALAALAEHQQRDRPWRA